MNAISICLTLVCGLTADSITVSAAMTDPQGLLIHDVQSPYQTGTTQIRVVLPDDMGADEKLPVVYVLPVEPGREQQYADGLTEIARHGWQNRYRAVYVAPTFSHIPWYADHPDEPTIRQETYFLEVVVPFVERTYPVIRERQGRLLLGFSKSGNGAWSLLLRHPEQFERASAWDSPLMMPGPGKYRSGEVFASQEHFDEYRLTDLLRANIELLQGEPRLIVTGYGNFREQHQQMHALLDELRIPHVYRDGPQREHHWNSGWLEESIGLLLHGAEHVARP